MQDSQRMLTNRRQAIKNISEAAHQWQTLAAAALALVSQMGHSLGRENSNIPTLSKPTNLTKPHAFKYHIQQSEAIQGEELHWWKKHRFAHSQLGSAFAQFQIHRLPEIANDLCTKSEGATVPHLRDFLGKSFLTQSDRTFGKMGHKTRNDPPISG
jgi:hypothetical protein